MTSRSLLLMLLLLMFMMAPRPSCAERLYYYRETNGTYVVLEPRTNQWVRVRSLNAYMLARNPRVDGFGGPIKHTEFVKAATIPGAVVDAAGNVAHGTAQVARRIPVVNRVVNPVTAIISRATAPITSAR